MVTWTGGRLPAPMSSTMPGGISMPVAVLPAARSVVRNLICTSLSRRPGPIRKRAVRARLEGGEGTPSVAAGPATQAGCHAAHRAGREAPQGCSVCLNGTHVYHATIKGSQYCDIVEAGPIPSCRILGPVGIARSTGPLHLIMMHTYRS